VERIMRTAQAPISLESPSGDEGETELGHLLPDESARLPEDELETAFRLSALSDCLATLSFRERRVLELRYGLNGELPSTLEEIGKLFEVTRERIRQIENQSLRKLRALPAATSLRDVA
jgi:RNA polymerase primary sigma factor